MKDRSDDRTSSDGKTGLEVLMMIIEKSLLPSLDESQRILAGPLIADLVQKVPSTISPALIVGEFRNPTSPPNSLERNNNATVHRNET